MKKPHGQTRGLKNFLPKHKEDDMEQVYVPGEEKTMNAREIVELALAMFLEENKVDSGTVCAVPADNAVAVRIGRNTYKIFVKEV